MLPKFLLLLEAKDKCGIQKILYQHSLLFIGAPLERKTGKNLQARPRVSSRASPTPNHWDPLLQSLYDIFPRTVLILEPYLIIKKSPPGLAMVTTALCCFGLPNFKWLYLTFGQTEFPALVVN